jgi:tetratricopeptide (TPR) repeat protein
LQDRVTANVAGAVEPKLRQAEIERVQTKATGSLTAYDYYLRALALYYDFTKESLCGAQILLEQALLADRRYSSAYALAALCRSSEVTQGWKVEDTDRAEALRLARLAAEFGKDDPSALAMAGRVLGSMQGDAEEGLALIERALALNPNAALAWQYCGWVSWQLGRHEQCIEYNEKAMRLSPLDAMIYRSYAGIAWAHFFLGKFNDAIIWAEKATREQPHFRPPLRIKIAAAAMVDRYDEMGVALQKLRAAQPDVSIRTLMQIHTSRLQSQRNFYEAALRKTGLT